MGMALSNREGEDECAGRQMAGGATGGDRREPTVDRAGCDERPEVGV